MENIVWHDHTVQKDMHSKQKKQKPCLLWFTGLSGAGKSTVANALERALFNLNQHTYLLDGDNVRYGLNKDLGFTDEDRIENIRRIGETSRLFVDAGLIVLSAFISPFRSDRELVRELMEDGEFVEIYVATPMNVCEDRDPKGLYQKARDGKIKNFTGIDSPYEPPESPEIEIDTAKLSVDESVNKILAYLRTHGLIEIK